ncbi:STN and carboxypeptidase regulatory-like domain-containing protein [Niabella beijingensis]|uniref:STN and carboxypeptidase regulatory-like domain-containing protein n=1 Tax=Niabella beijingensis TaxID=2872700 RepID=UPI001CBBF986|nr:STN and carboxypeptidase regulatory-like domain-containing protein [Niabella beijingensis]MBZ4190932.1 carboxypeptidase-like regulatory domain-containing protein [Niabella beijingensis]
MKPFFFIFLVFFFATGVCAQTDGLQKVISVDFRNITMYDALRQIEARAGFYFSYDNQFIRNQKKISFTAADKPVKEILNQILDNEYQYIVQNNKVIIRKKEQAAVEVRGRFVDNSDQTPVAYVSVYVPELQIGTMSDQEGFFSLKVPRSDQLLITASRISYEDTVFSADNNSDRELNIALTPHITEAPEIRLNTVQRHWLARRLIGSRQKLSSINLKNYFYQRKFQLGVLPGIATKNVLKGQQENNFSFNVLGGYAAQVDAVEIGGLFNIVQKHVHSVQIGGLANIVGGGVNGVQVGGMYNYVGDSMQGVQIGGLVNTAQQHTGGVQVAGWYNGTSAFNGLQIAGLMNRVRDSSTGLQLAGLVNVAGTVSEGVQLSGLVNRASKIKGLQLGLVNLADTLRGVAIGPVNYHRNGKHALSVSWQENNQLNVAYRSGSYTLYNVVQGGVTFAPGGEHYYSFGYGLGSEWVLKKKIKMAAELVNLFYTSADRIDLNYTNLSFQPLLLYQLRPKLQLFAGPRLQYPMPGKEDAASVQDALNRNMLAINPGSKDVLYLGWTVGINIF